MDAIAQIDGLRAFAFPNDHPAVKCWLDPEHGLIFRIARALELRGDHVARTVVLLPYAQLLPLAQRMWCRAFPDGFAPHFETSRNWATQLGGGVAGPTDITLNIALDTLTAQCLVAQAGSESSRALADLIVEAAHALAPVVAGIPPEDRAAWLNEARSSVAAAPVLSALSVEARATRIALEWAAQSGFVTDVLFSEPMHSHVDALVVVEGLAPDPLHRGLQKVWSAKSIQMPLVADRWLSAVEPDGHVSWHACTDAEDEAQRGCALMLRHIASGRFPLALVSSDRALTRRMRAMLEHAGVAIRDETGWKLSTTRAAAHTMALLGAAKWNASTDTILELLKASPAWSSDAETIERIARKASVSIWHKARVHEAYKVPQLQATLTGVDTLRALFQGVRPLTEWLGLLQEAFDLSGLASTLADDAAGEALGKALWIDGDASLPAALDGKLWSGATMDLADFTAWVNLTLEQAIFQLPYPDNEQVVILPMSQMLSRPFAAVVLAGCDEVRLPLSPDPGGPWSAAQRVALGLPSREEQSLAVREAWSHALQTPNCDVLWRTSDAAGEPLLASPLVLYVQNEQAGGHHALATNPTDDPRTLRHIAPNAQGKPLPVGAGLAVTSLSASTYESLRQCPYRFFALQQLGLSRAEELETDLDKRDFGLWLHAVLEQFHVALASKGQATGAELGAMLDGSSDLVTQQLGLEPEEFLPFMAAWPAVRDGYLKWWGQHQANGAAFESGEVSLMQKVGEVSLRGRVDRVDRLQQGVALVLDYKTESISKTRSRVKDPLEDTQLAFYAALMPDDAIRAAYVNVSERDGTNMVEQKNLLFARDALLQGIDDDMRRIRSGSPLPALGDGPACEYCDARGLCRKDFWGGR